MTRVVLVTGANKGVGYGIVRQLILQSSSPLTIYLTSRDEGRGRKALEQISHESDIISPLQKHTLEYQQLDVTDQQSVDRIKNFMVKEHGGVHVLINNAGVAAKGDAFDSKVVHDTLECTFKDIIGKEGRIVNVSSMASKLHKVSPELQKRFRDPKLTLDKVDQLMQEFEAGVKDNSYAEKGWPKQSYSVSKMGVTALTRALALECQFPVNCVCPGWVRTDMAGDKAPKSIDEGALTPVHVAIGDIDGQTGKFWEDQKVSEW